MRCIYTRKLRKERFLNHAGHYQTNAAGSPCDLLVTRAGLSSIGKVGTCIGPRIVKGPPRRHKNSSGDEIANVNFFYNIAHVEASDYAH